MQMLSTSGLTVEHQLKLLRLEFQEIFFFFNDSSQVEYTSYWWDSAILTQFLYHSLHTGLFCEVPRKLVHHNPLTFQKS